MEPEKYNNAIFNKTTISRGLPRTKFSVNVEGYMYLINKTVTSDCIPLEKSKNLVMNKELGLIQTEMDSKWFSEIEKVYASYNIYQQADGLEQVTFADEKGMGEARSERIISSLKKQIVLPSYGEALDYGCGNGGFLKVLSKNLENWGLYGSEYNDKYKKEVEAINGFKGFFTEQNPVFSKQFDLVSLIHLLEHIPKPFEFLKQIKKNIKPGGLLLIELPFHVDNPYELAIYDHATHFTLNSIKHLLIQSGFQIIEITNQWVRKEITVVATPIGDNYFPNSNPEYLADDEETLKNRITFLNTVFRQAQEAFSRSETKAIFGSSIAASWLYSKLNGDIDYFVDEDSNRHGNSHLETKIIPPSELPQNSCLFVVQPIKIANNIANRLREKLSNSIRIISPKKEY